MQPDAVQIRVLGALMEKQRTVPDAYPLTLNALRAACNQTTNRDPVVDYDDAAIRHALEELARRRFTRSAGGTRAAKYRHLLADTLQMRPDEQAVLAVLMLRGPQTAAELRQRTERLHAFTSTDELETTIDRLVTRKLAVRLQRRPGQKEGRVQQTMGGEEPAAADVAGPGTGSNPAYEPRATPAGPDPAVAELQAQVVRLEEQVGGLRAAVRALAEELGVEVPAADPAEATAVPESAPAP